ncbi:MAG TPA: MarR family transcriptional regulator [Solirubrobacteraceae bacterium]|jgi:DNA-binding MarR family transcriptional regulator
MPLDERLGTDIRRVHQELMAVKHEALKAAGLTVPQYSALYFVKESPGISGAELARQCLVTPQTMAAVLRNLESSGLIDRHPHPWHRNVVETKLTATGRRALVSADAAASRIERRLADRFTAHERDTLRRLLRECSAELAVIADEA